MYCHCVINKKHLKNVGPIRHCEPPHAHSPDVATDAACASMSTTTPTTTTTMTTRDRGDCYGMGPTTAISRTQTLRTLCEPERRQLSRKRGPWRRCRGARSTQSANSWTRSASQHRVCTAETVAVESSACRRQPEQRGHSPSSSTSAIMTALSSAELQAMSTIDICLAAFGNSHVGDITHSTARWLAGWQTTSELDECA